MPGVGPRCPVGALGPRPGRLPDSDGRGDGTRASAARSCAGKNRATFLRPPKRASRRRVDSMSSGIVGRPCVGSPASGVTVGEGGHGGRLNILHGRQNKVRHNAYFALGHASVHPPPRQAGGRRIWYLSTMSKIDRPNADWHTTAPIPMQEAVRTYKELPQRKSRLFPAISPAIAADQNEPASAVPLCSMERSASGSG